MHVVIVGNGITGITAARFIRKRSDHRITVISSETDHHYARTALMYIYMGHMRYDDTKPYEDHFWPENRIEILRDHVTGLDTDGQAILLASGERIGYDKLLLATGSRPNRFAWPGQDLPGVQGLYGMPDLERMESNTREARNAVVVGGGLIGVEMAEMLRSRGIQVSFLVREQGYMDYVLPKEEQRLVEKAITAHGVDLRLGAELKAIQEGADRRVEAVTTGDGSRIEADFVGLAVGVRPNVDLAHGTSIQTNRGFLVDESFGTSVENVYAAGDCAEFRSPPDNQKAVEQLWYTGRHQGRAVGRLLAGEHATYQRPIFFNSAKFFDLEYQTYGAVPVEGPSLCIPDEGRLLRIAYDPIDQAVTGFNGLGIRLRQSVCAHWIRNRAGLGTVAAQIEAAVFDSEFSRPIGQSVRGAAPGVTGASVSEAAFSTL